MMKINIPKPSKELFVNLFNETKGFLKEMIYSFKTFFGYFANFKVELNESKFDVFIRILNANFQFVFPKFVTKVLWSIKSNLSMFGGWLASKFTSTRLGKRVSILWAGLPRFVRNGIKLVIILGIIFLIFLSPKIKNIAAKYKDYAYNNRPELIYISIHSGESNVELDRKIEFKLSKSVSASKLENHIKSRSNLDLDIEKIGSKTYEIKIQDGLKIDNKYSIVFSDDKILKGRDEITFSTIETPKVVATNIKHLEDKNDRILVSFSPNINLNEISKDNPAFLSNIVRFEPAIKGSVELLTPSVIRFVPESTIPTNSEIKIIVNNDQIVNELGLAMTKPFENKFVVKEVIKSSEKKVQEEPYDYNNYRGKVLRVYSDVLNLSNTPIKVALRNDVDTVLFEQTTRISKNGYAIPLIFSWETLSTSGVENAETYLDFFQYGDMQTEFKLVTISISENWDSKNEYLLNMDKAIYGYNSYSDKVNVVNKLDAVNSNIKDGILKDGSYLRINFNNELLYDEKYANSVKLVNKTTNQPMDAKPYFSYDTLSVWGDFKPENQYIFSVPSDISDVFGQELGKQVSFEFTVEKYEPEDLPTFINIFGRDEAYVENTGKHRILLESRRLNNINVQVKRLTVDDYRKWINSTSKGTIINEVGTKVEQWTKSFDNFAKDKQIRNQRLEFQYPLENQKDGIYLINASSEKNDYQSSKIIFLSKYVGVVKTSNDLNEAMVWIVEGKNGQPASNIDININYADSKQQTGKTNSDGVVKFSNIIVDDFTYISSPNSEIYFESGGSYALDDNYYWGYDYDNTNKVYVYFDKPVYRPGNTFSYKVFARKIQGNDLVSSTDPVNIQINDDQGNPIYSNTVKLNEFGTGSADFVLGENLSSGEYSVIADGSYMDSFRIEDYEIFNFAFKLDTPQNKLYQPFDSVPITISGNYYFGEPLADSNVEANLFVRDIELWDMWEFMGDKYSNFDFTGEDYTYGSTYASRKVGSYKFKTDSKGVGKANIPLNIPSDIRNNKFKLLSIEVKVEDKLGEAEYSTVYAYVVPNVEIIGSQQDKYSVREGESITTQVAHLNSFFKPISGSNMKFVYKRLEETQVKKKTIGGVYSWVTQIEQIEENVDIVPTNFNGIATSVYYPQTTGNYYVYVYKGEDTKPIRTMYFSYIDKDSSEYYYDYDNYYYRNSNEVTLETDKETYDVGQTAKITPLLKSGKYIALETIEKKGVLSYKVIDMSKTPKLEAKMGEDAHPNFYYSLFMLQPRSFGSGYLDYRYGSVNIAVSEEDKEINVKINTDKEKYSPQDEVELKLELSQNGKLIEDKAEILVAVVDKAVLDVSKIKHNENLDEKMIGQFWSNWMKGVSTATNILLYENKIIDETEWGNKGGDVGIGGDGGGGRRPLQLEDVRKEFKEVALWLPTEYSDNGTYTTKFKVPDNLTTWEIVAIAITKDTEVGANTKEIKVSKDTSIVSGVPRQLVMGDEVDTVFDIRFDEDFRKTILNDRIDVQLEAEGLKVMCDNNELKDFCIKNIPISSLPVEFRVVTENSGSHKLRFGVFNGTKTLDAEEIVVEVLPDTATEQYIKTGKLNGTNVFEYEFPPKTIEESKYIELTVSDKPFNDMAYFENYFISYEHYCSEQTSSRILSLLGVGETDNIRQSIEQGISHLYTMQNVDGGWGIWGNDSSLTFNTAYVLYALDEAKKFGFDVNDGIVTKGKGYINHYTQNLADYEFLHNDNLFVLSVLASQDLFYMNRVNNIYDSTEIASFSNLDKIYLLEIYDAYRKSISPIRIFERGFVNNRIERIKSELYESLIENEDFAYWTNTGLDNEYYYNNDIKTTAMAFDILARIDKNDNRLEKVMKYLINKMENRYILDTNTNFYMKKAFITANDIYQIDIDKAQPVIVVNGQEYKIDTNVEMTNILIPIRNVGDKIEVKVLNAGEGDAYFDLKVVSKRKYEDIEPLQNGISIYSESTVDDGKEIRKGDVFEQTVYLFVNEKLGQIALSNPIPAGSDIINFSLARMSESLEEEYSIDNYNNERYFPHKSIKDEGLYLYSSDYVYGYQLDRGIYKISFPVRAAYSGKFKTLGANAKEMYYPSRSAQNKADIIEINY